jgi:hypothetical protein
MNGYIDISLDEYGFMFDSQWAYVALSWELLIIGGVIATALVIFKKWNNRK